MERKEVDVKKVGSLLETLVSREIFNKVDIMLGLKDTLEFAEDMSIDIPELYKFLGIILGTLVLGDILTIRDVYDVTEALRSSTATRPPALVVLSQMLKFIKTEESESTAAEIYQTDATNVEDFFPENKRSKEVVEEWIERNGLGFLNPMKAIASGLKERLDKLDLSGGKDQVDQIVAWLMVHFNLTLIFNQALN